MKTAKDRPPRALGYCRISRDLRDGAGVERQRKDVEDRAAAEGFELIEVLIDNDIGASTYSRKRRPGWDRVMEAIEHGEVDAIVAFSLDRLTRRPAELEAIIAAADRGLTIVTTSGGALPDLNTPDGKLVGRLLTTVAAREIDDLSKRARAKLGHDASNGVAHWARRPYGYAMPTKTATGERVRPEIVEAEAIQIQWAAKQVIAGASLSAVANQLNDKGIPTATGKAKWSAGGLGLLLESARNAGKRTHHGEIVGDAEWDSIIDIDTFGELQRIFANRRRGSTVRRNKGKARTLLSGFVFCGGCGGRMYRTGADTPERVVDGRKVYARRAVMQCRSRKRGGCGNTMTACFVEDIAIETVLAWIGDRDLTAPVSKVGDAVAELEAELEELGSMYGLRQITMVEWMAARGPLEAQLEAAQAASAAVIDRHELVRSVGDTSTLRQRWVGKSLSIEAKHEIMRRVIERVTVAPSAGRSLDFARVDVELVGS
jgi:site-specific DNA recombinase